NFKKSTGVITGDNVRKLFQYAHEHSFAIPAVNVSSSSTINAALEAARDIKAPLIIQLSQGGSQFYAGKGLSNEGQRASIIGAISAAHHVRHVAKEYGMYFDGMLEADEEYFVQHGEPFVQLDLSEESKDENIAIC
ncbi:1015_t:CDS:2, partial [Ambispora leptoticha]